MGSAKLTGKVKSDNYAYNCYGIGFNLLSQFSLPGGSSAKNVITFGVENTSSVHIDKYKKNDVEDKCSIKFTESEKKICIKSAL